ncbi:MULTISPECIES: HAMP domain-containing sensor histidine kinase [unclassified Amycolatopsis]|uniref:sensor histidine kinase n=1 Tax=unclassified Amycolatopsis TaxID=2618356 RepID=UPI0028760F5F|nr:MULTISPECIES: HAMP domain-containing sensor histidine kinase [unclassified Amycolatopsis]MDS0139731.1 HAMP domain-containing histidine kinase [Amycolatopsis sp. 505]MDS0145154.1 HAMP domain-containing histidine kinase [Amycolatopsis sp. CM201R]
MRVRLQGIVLTLVALLVFGLGIPLARSIAAGAQQDLFLDRLTDTARFASLAQRPLLDNKPGLIEPDLIRYTDVYGVQALVVNQDGKLFASSLGQSARIDLKDDRVSGPVHEALAGRRSQPTGVLMPWDSTPLVLAEPVLADGEVHGAVLTVSDTGAERADVLWWWLLLAAGGILAFTLALAVAIPVVRWILRPVHRLDDATGALVASVVSGREAEPVGESGGPPELRQLGRSFDRMASSVSGALAAQRAFVADASHQLRNPLTALKIRLGNLEGHVDDEPAAADLEAARVDAGRLHQILDGLLSMARAEASGGELDPVVLDEVVADRVADWSVVGEARDVRLVVETSGDGARVCMPPRGAETILDALLDNALKFTAAGTEILVAVARSGDRVRLSVRDHGPGLPPEELDRALDRFWRSPAHQNVPGSGLGLAIVSEIVAHSDGELALELPEGGGLRISMVFPVA